MGRNNSVSPIRADGSPRRRSPSRRERSPAGHRSSNADRLSSRNRSPKRARSRSPAFHSPVREKSYSRTKSPNHRKSPSRSPVRQKQSSRMRSPKHEKSRSSPPLSPRSKRLKRAKAERDAEKGSEKEHEKNHVKKGDRAIRDEKNLERDLPIEKKDRRPGREAAGNGSRSRHERSYSPSNRHRRGQRRSRSPYAADNRGHNEDDRIEPQRYYELFEKDTIKFGNSSWIQMGSEIETVEQRLKSFTNQFHTECGILERLVYKHKNQHRRCSYFQYILEVRRDLKLLKLANLDEILDASFLVINGNRPKQKVHLLESLKRRICGGSKYNFLERLLGVTRLLSQMVEPLLKAAMEISTLLARSFFMKFSLTILAVLARIRVLVQQMLLDAVLLYNNVSSLSQREQTVKLNQEGFEVFREYYPRKEEANIMLECIWQTDKYVLVERTYKSETTSQEKDDRGDLSLSAPKIQYQNIEVLLGAKS